jgi:predicted MFS family arabinose efflux permease
MTSIDSLRGRTVLIVAHCAGMLDLVALALWVGALVTRYGFDPQQAGGLATLFLAGVVVASVVLAPRFHRLQGRTVATAGFAVSALGCGLASTVKDFGTLALLHALCGLATGAALSFTHGTIARSARPQRLFAFAGTGLGVFAVAINVATPMAIGAVGGPGLFMVFGAVMAVAALACLLGFPQAAPGTGAATPGAAPAPLVAAVWFGIAGIAFMSVMQSMAFSFVEPLGRAKGFTVEMVTGVLIAVAIATLFPAPLAALLEKRLSSRGVLLAGPLLHGLMVAAIVTTTGLPPYAVATCLLPCLMVFTHTFAFGLLARLDPSGRALAATPAMLMVGAASGPVIGGTLIKSFGYGSLGVAAAVLAAAAFLCFSRLPSGKGAAASPALASTA